jgi:hypothetical protein
MAEEKKKPQFRIEKIADVGTENKFVSRLTLQMFDFLECTLLEEEKIDDIKKKLFGLMQLFLREEKWITEYLNDENEFLREAAFKDFPIKEVTNLQKSRLGQLDQRIKAFFLNLILAFNECYKIASIILDTEIKNLDSLSKKVESSTSENNVLRSITSNKSPLAQALKYFDQLIWKFTLGPQHIYQHSISNKIYIAVNPTDPEIHIFMDMKLNEFFEQIEGLLIYLILLRCPNGLKIEVIDEKNRNPSNPIKYFIRGLRNQSWIPYFGYYWWEPPSDKSKAQESENNKAERDFYVNFYLERMEWRKIDDSLFRIKDERVIHQESQKYGQMDIKLFKNDKDRLRMISCRLCSTNRDDALKRAYKTVTYFLSLQTFVSGNASSIYTMSIEDSQNKAIWTCKPQSGIEVPLLIPEAIGFTKEFEMLLSIYREAKNSQSPFYRFLCYYKILEAFYEHRYIFSKTDQIIREKRLQIKRPKRIITKSMVVKAMLHHRMDEFRGKSYSKYFEYLRSKERIMVAHVFPVDKRKDIADLNDYDLYAEFVSLGNLTDLVARDILHDELMLWQNIHERKEKKGLNDSNIQ